MNQPQSRVLNPAFVIGAALRPAVPDNAAGRAAFEAGLMGPRDFASPSTPVVGTPFRHAVS